MRLFSFMEKRGSFSRALLGVRGCGAAAESVVIMRRKAARLPLSLPAERSEPPPLSRGTSSHAGTRRDASVSARGHTTAQGQAEERRITKI